MNDYPQGSFGFSNPTGNSFTNIGGMHMLAGKELNSNMPNISSMYGSSSQKYFNPYSVSPIGYGYQSPQQSMHDYGVIDTIKHEMLGAPRSLGMSSLDSTMAKEEYRHLTATTMAGDALNIGASTGIGMAGAAMGGFAGFVAGSVGAMPVSAAIGYGLNTHIDNYKRTQRTGSIFSNIANKDGSMGLSGKAAAKITKGIDKLASEDLMLDSEDMMNIMSAAKDNGMFAKINPSQISGKFKDIKDNLKAIADIMGTSDLKEVMKQLGNFNQMNFSASGSKTAIGNLLMAGKSAGLSTQATLDSYNADVMAGTSRGIDARLTYKDTVSDQFQMKSLQQSGLMSSSMSNTKTYLAASRESRSFLNDINKNNSGTNRAMELVYAGYKSKKDGSTLQEAMSSLNGLSESEKSAKIFSYDGGIGYQHKLTNSSAAAAYSRNLKGVEKLDLEDDFSKAFKRYSKAAGPGASSDEIFTMMTANKSGQNLSPEAREKLFAQVSIANTHGLDYLKKQEKVGRRMAMKREIIDKRTREDEKNGIYGSISLGLQSLKYDIKDFVGGYDSASDMQDKARSNYGNHSTSHDYLDTGLKVKNAHEMSRDDRIRLASKIGLSEIKSAANNIDYADYGKVTGRLSGESSTWNDALTMSFSKYREKNNNSISSIFGGSIGQTVGMVGRAVRNTGLLLGATFGADVSYDDFTQMGQGTDEDKNYLNNKKANQEMFKSNRRIGNIKSLGKKSDRENIGIDMIAKRISKESGEDYSKVREAVAMKQSGKSSEDYDYIRDIRKKGGSDNFVSDRGQYLIETDEFFKRDMEIASKMSDSEVLKHNENKRKEIDSIINKKIIEGKKRGRTNEQISSDIKQIPIVSDALNSGAYDPVETYSSSEDGIKKDVLGQMLLGQNISEDKLKELKITDKNLDAGEKFMTDMGKAGLDNKTRKEMISKLSDGTSEKEMATYLQAIARKDGNKMLSDDDQISMLSRFTEAKKNMSGEDGELSKENADIIIAKANQKRIESRGDIRASLKSSTGLKDEKDITKLMGVFSGDSSTWQEKFNKIKLKDEDFKNIKFKDVADSLAKSSIYDKESTGKDLYSNGASSEKIQAKTLDAITAIKDAVIPAIEEERNGG